MRDIVSRQLAITEIQEECTYVVGQASLSCIRKQGIVRQDQSERFSNGEDCRVEESA